jgi:hypothetical protein
MQKPKVLLVVPGFMKDRPQTIRMRGLFKPLLNKYDIQVLSNYRVNQSFIWKGFKIIGIKPSFIGLLINPNYYSHEINFKILNNKIYSIIRYLIKPFCFPDFYSIELKKINKTLKQILSNQNYIAVLGSCSPFSIYKTGLTIKKHNIKWILDLGDPFIENSTINQSEKTIRKKNIFEKKYMSIVDYLVVTNDETRKLYIDKYSNLNSDNTIVIPQGIEKTQTKNSKRKYSVDINKDISLIYVGSFYKKLREPFELFKAIKEWNKKSESFKINLNLYGKISDFFLKEISDNHIQYQGFIPFSEVVKQYKKHDLIIILDNAEGFQTPGKLIEVLDINKPSVLIYNSKYTPSYNLIKESGVPLIKNCKKEIINFFKKIENGDSKIEINFSSDNFTWSNLSQKIDSIISRK